ncbi:L,D-transpeptidase [Tunicatimonas pelagia]|uniref:L,D-transpeptidase n=1 Tax=Tunicatimonas pelagia TaxID=931531 RepID=UPI002666869D|nr:L,D-transpeptidase [Tunicatimonas pelagia]WKN44353.1 L,D-transpeptidase [Tunicatimonas pelagia]
MKIFVLISGLLICSLLVNGQSKEEPFIKVSVAEQKLYLMEGGQPLKQYPVSTSAYGIGSKAGSNKTPLGKHEVISKFGDNAPLGTIFRSRINTGRTAKIYTDDTDLEQDDVTTRILRLTGLEPGKNQGSGVDSFSRYIYIHGTPEEGLIGRPASHGCIRMKNTDVVELYDLVDEGTLVVIER